MTVLIQHAIITGAYIPLIKREFDQKQTYITFQDNYPSTFKRYGISRDEMMVLMPQIMSVDPLSGTDKLTYIGEDKI